MPTDMVKLLAIISVLNVPGNHFETILHCLLVTQAVPFRSLTPVAQSRSRILCRCCRPAAVVTQS
jgi:hypothetical protein